MMKGLKNNFVVAKEEKGSSNCSKLIPVKEKYHAFDITHR